MNKLYIISTISIIISKDKVQICFPNLKSYLRLFAIKRSYTFVDFIQSSDGNFFTVRFEIGDFYLVYNQLNK